MGLVYITVLLSYISINLLIALFGSFKSLMLLCKKYQKRFSFKKQWANTYGVKVTDKEIEEWEINFKKQIKRDEEKKMEKKRKRKEKGILYGVKMTDKEIEQWEKNFKKQIERQNRREKRKKDESTNHDLNTSRQNLKNEIVEAKPQHSVKKLLGNDLSEIKEESLLDISNMK